MAFVETNGPEGPKAYGSRTAHVLLNLTGNPGALVHWLFV